VAKRRAQADLSAGSGNHSGGVAQTLIRTRLRISISI
jgi:hypothetical protein